MATHTIETADEIIIGLGKGGQIAVGTQRLTSDVVTHVFMYGLRQILNDAHASEKEAEHKAALSEKRLQALYDGKLGRQASGPRPVDPVAKEAKRLATEQLMAFLKGKGLKRADVSDEKWAAALAKGVEKMTAQAKRNVAAMAGDVEIDLED